MSLARKCDRCKKLFEPKIASNGYLNTYHSLRVTIENHNKVLDSLYNSDLCPECYAELRAWMEMEEEKKILVSFMNFQNDWKDMMKEIADRISIVQPIVDYKLKIIEIELRTPNNIVILFKPASVEFIKGTRPDYYWTNSYDVDKYYRHCPDAKCLQNFAELTNLVLTECQRKEY